MSQLVHTQITIDGRSVTNFSSLTLSQCIFKHHGFCIVCPAEAIDDMAGPVFNASRNLIGRIITIEMDAIGGGQGALQFKGVVTQVEACRYSGYTAGDIIISGHSPTILMDGEPLCKTWENMSISNIAQDVIMPFDQSLLQPQIAPSYSTARDYTVQYKETAWQFLNRLAATYGEWFFYDGE